MEPVIHEGASNSASDFDVDFTYPFLRAIDPSHPPSSITIPVKYLDAMANMERQYWEIKSQHYNVVIFFKKGKFYELYDYDAVIAHREFGLKMVFDTTNRGKMRLAGVPEQSFAEWARLFVFRGYKVGRVEQLREDSVESGTREASKVKIVPRALVEVLTPGTLTDPLMLCDHSEIYLLAFCPRIVYSTHMQAAPEHRLETWIVDALAIDLSRRVVLWCPCGEASIIKNLVHVHCQGGNNINQNSTQQARTICADNVNTYKAPNSVQTTYSFSTLLQHLRPKEVIMTFTHIDMNKMNAGNNKNSTNNTNTRTNINVNTICETLRKEVLLEGLESEVLDTSEEMFVKEKIFLEKDCNTKSDNTEQHITATSESFWLMAHYLRSLRLERYVPLLLTATVYDAHLEKKCTSVDNNNLNGSSANMSFNECTMEMQSEESVNKEPMHQRKCTLLQWESKHDHGLILDAVTLSNLELLRNLHDGSTRHSLLEFFNQCVTNGGKRLFRRWLLRPSSSHVVIRARQEVARFFSKYVFCQAHPNYCPASETSAKEPFCNASNILLDHKTTHISNNINNNNNELMQERVQCSFKQNSKQLSQFCMNNTTSQLQHTEKREEGEMMHVQEWQCTVTASEFSPTSSTSLSATTSLSLSSMNLSPSPPQSYSSNSPSLERITQMSSHKRQRELGESAPYISSSSNTTTTATTTNTERANTVCISQCSRSSTELFTLHECYVEFAKLNQIDLERSLSRVTELKFCTVQIAYVDAMMQYRRELETILTAINGFRQLLKWAVMLSVECTNHHITLPPLLAELIAHVVCIGLSIEAIEKLYNHDEVAERGMLIPEKGACSEYDEAVAQIAHINKELEHHRRKAEIKFFNGASVEFCDLGKDQFLLEVAIADAPRHTPVGMVERARSAKTVKYTVNALSPLITDYKKYTIAKETALFTVLHSIAARICVYFPQLHEAASALSYIDCLLNLARMTKYNTCESCFPYICSDDINDSLYNITPAPASSLAVCALTNMQSNHQHSSNAKQLQESFDENETVYRGGFLRAVQIVHPLLMRNAVANNVHLGGGDAEHGPILLLTGPNMAGKSTLMRTLAVNVILAQLGAPVCAKQMELKPFDRIFTRIGARDAGEKGQSTLYVELSETAEILRSATMHSLCLVDELGRGTSTHDGYAVAYATLQWLKEMLPHPPITIFSTHYHALANEEQVQLDVPTNQSGVHIVQLGYMNYVINTHSSHAPEHTSDFVHHTTSHESLAKVTFLYQLVHGVCARSYGVEVALMAGIPRSLVHLAKIKSTQLSASTSIHQSLQRIKYFLNA